MCMWQKKIEFNGLLQALFPSFAHFKKLPLCPDVQRSLPFCIKCKNTAGRDSWMSTKGTYSTTISGGDFLFYPGLTLRNQLTYHLN